MKNTVTTRADRNCELVITNRSVDCIMVARDKNPNPNWHRIFGEVNPHRLLQLCGVFDCIRYQCGADAFSCWFSFCIISESHSPIGSKTTNQIALVPETRAHRCWGHCLNISHMNKCAANCKLRFKLNGNAQNENVIRHYIHNYSIHLKFTTNSPEKNSYEKSQNKYYLFTNNNNNNKWVSSPIHCDRICIEFSLDFPRSSLYSIIYFLVRSSFIL